MKYLVDTHVLLWSFFEPGRLSGEIRELLLNEENAIYYSVVSLWEISIKYGLQKLSLGGMTPEDFYEELAASYYLEKRINPVAAITNFRLPQYHKDPFDRLIIGEAIKEDYILLSRDSEFAAYQKDGLRLIG